MFRGTCGMAMDATILPVSLSRNYASIPPSYHLKYFKFNYNTNRKKEMPANNYVTDLKGCKSSAELINDLMPRCDLNINAAENVRRVTTRYGITMITPVTGRAPIWREKTG